MARSQRSLPVCSSTDCVCMSGMRKCCTLHFKSRSNHVVMLRLAHTCGESVRGQAVVQALCMDFFPLNPPKSLRYVALLLCFLVEEMEDSECFCNVPQDS